MSTEPPKVTVRGKRQTKTAQALEKKPKARYSCFLLTISTGQSYADDDPHRENDAEVLEQSVKEILHDLPRYVRVLDDGKWDSTFIHQADCEYAIEFGSKRRVLHAHLLFKIRHTTRVLLNYDAIKEKLKQDLGLPNLYMLNRLVRPTSEDFLQRYLEKSY